MSTQLETTAQTRSQARGSAMPALLVELESTATGGRGLAFKIIQEELRPHGISLPHPVFARIGTLTNPRFYLDALIEQTGADIPADAFKEAVMRRFTERFASGDIALVAGLDKLVAATLADGGKVGVVTALPTEAAESAFSRLGLDASSAQLFAAGGGEDHFPGADVWLKAAKGLGRTARHCIAAVDCNFSCKTALSAGARCLAVPDEFTGYQDFGGADIVLDAWGDMSAKEILVALRPAGV